MLKVAFILEEECTAMARAHEFAQSAFEATRSVEVFENFKKNVKEMAVVTTGATILTVAFIGLALWGFDIIQF